MWDWPMYLFEPQFLFLENPAVIMGQAPSQTLDMHSQEVGATITLTLQVSMLKP